jgi:hypothetical protein
MIGTQDEIKVKEIVKGTVMDIMTDVMMPVLDKILIKLDEHAADMEDVKLTVNRIETLQRSELNRVDDHEIRIGKLEQAIAK